MSLISDLAGGGCIWRKQPNSPGHTFSVPSGTQFRVSLKGPQSHIYMAGVCRKGEFFLTEGKLAGKGFPSASSVVNAVREPSTNAFLHMHFLLYGRYVAAEELRLKTSEECVVEEKALEIALEIIERSMRLRNPNISISELDRSAAVAVLRSTSIMDEARRRVSVMNALSLSDLGLG